MAGIFGLLMSGAGVIKDQYYNLTSLLLPGNGTNGAQNNTFLDSSNNTFTITRNGNTTQGTFSPFSQTGWGNYFDGSSAYLNGDGSAGLALSTGDFTIEFWTFVNSTSGNPQFISFNPASTNGAYPLIYLNSGVLTYYVNNTAVITGASVSTGVWNHIALSRSGTSTKMFLNGTQTGSTYTDTNDYLVGTSRPTIGRAGFNAAGYLNGYISNLRVVKGRAVYTTTFTPPISPLGLTSGGVNPPQGSETKLLTCQSNRFVDAAGTTITVSGSPQVTPFSPFAPTQSYSAAAVGGSGYFDGTGDYLTVPDNAAFDLPGDFTIEMWVYASVSPGGTKSFITHADVSSNGWALGFNGTGTNLFWYTNSSFILNTSSGLVLNAWNHVAAVRSGTSLVIYINGTSAGSVTNSTSYAGTGLLYVGSDQFSQSFTGTLSGVRIVKGQALASGNFTPPTAPVTTSTVGWTGANAAGSLTGTVSLLLNFTNAGVVDATAKNVLETVGNAQISTTQSKWGGGSMYFDGNGDYIPQYGLLLPTTGDFTVEAWIRVDSLSATRTIFGCGSAGTKLAFLVGTSGLVGVQTGSAYLESAGSLIATNTWYHVALTRTSNTYKIFVDGTERTLSGVGTMLTTISNSPQVVGAYSDTFGGSPFSGYMDDFRISMFRRYTSNFTAPTAPFPVQ